MVMTISSTFPAPPGVVWHYLKHTATFRYVTFGLLRIVQTQLPRVWTEGARLNAVVKPLAILPGWEHQIHISKMDGGAWELHTQEHGGLFRQWNHSIYLRAQDRDKTRYTDYLEFSAPFCEGTLARLLRAFFRYRHFRWRRLLRRRYRKVRS